MLLEELSIKNLFGNHYKRCFTLQVVFQILKNGP